MITALKGCVVLKPDHVRGEEVTTSSGLIVELKHTKREGNNVQLAFGTVVAVNEVDNVSVGDRVGYNPYDGFEFEFEEKQYECVRGTGLMVKTV